MFSKICLPLRISSWDAQPLVPFGLSHPLRTLATHAVSAHSGCASHFMALTRVRGLVGPRQGAQGRDLSSGGEHKLLQSGSQLCTRPDHLLGASQLSGKVSTIIPILQLGKLRLRDTKSPSQGCIASKRQCWDFPSGLPTPCPGTSCSYGCLSFPGTSHTQRRALKKSCCGPAWL